MYTIKDLVEGRVAVINDGTLEELEKILKAAFPNDPITPSGCHKYYFKNTYTHKFWLSAEWVMNMNTQSVKDFLKQIEEPWIPKRGDRVLVSGNDGIERERIFLTKIEGSKYPYVVVNKYQEDRFENGESFDTISYQNMKPLSTSQPQTELTMEEIAEKFGIDVNNLKIVK